MSNSALANYINRMTGSYTDRYDLIDRITIHSARKVGTIHDLAELINQSDDTAYHYGIATDGTIGLFVDEQYATYSTSNSDNDSKAVNIIVMNSTDASNCPVSEATYTALIKLCVDICRRNYILKFKYLPNNRDASNLTMHSWYANIDCPGAYLSSRFTKIADEVNSQIASTRLASSETESLKARSTITIGGTSPYMVVPDDDAINIDYKGMRDTGVIGVMLHAGAYYDQSHRKVQKYINPYLKKQVAEVQSANLPHALYATVRAKNRAEARAECYELYFVVSKYPPKLGLWLKLELAGLMRSKAQEVVNTYYEQMYKWGFKDKSGLYCTQTMASLINWPQYTNKFALWLISPLGNVNNLEEVLTPQLFKL